MDELAEAQVHELALWLDLGQAEPVLYVLDAASLRLHQRKLAVHATPDAVDLELVRYVTMIAIDAVLDGSAEGITRAKFDHEVPTLAPVPGPTTAPIAPRLDRPVEAHAGYQGIALALPHSSPFAHGLALSVRTTLATIEVGAAVGLTWPVTAHAENKTFACGRAGFAWGQPFLSRWAPAPP